MPRSSRFCGSGPCRIRPFFAPHFVQQSRPHLKPLSLWQQDRPDLQQLFPTSDPHLFW